MPELSPAEAAVMRATWGIRPSMSRGENLALAKAIGELIDEKIAAAFNEFIEPDGHMPVPKSDVFSKLARHPGKQRP